MVDKAHKLLTDPDIHEPKGISTATADQVYRADGAGSGSWQTITIPTGLFNISLAAFTASGTWTKPDNCFMVKVICIGGGGDLIAGTAGTSSFGAYCSATGGSASAPGDGSGDVNFTGEDENVSTTPPQAGLKFGAYGQGAPGDGTNTGGAGGGACIKYLYSFTDTVSVTVGAGLNTGKDGYVLVEQYTTV